MGEREGLRERKRRATATRVELTALRLFDEKGFDDTTVDDIADAAEVSRATVFRYFGSKDDIVYAIEPDLLEHLRGLVRTPNLSLADAVVAYAEHVDANVPDLRDRAAVIAMTPKLVERFAHVRTRWELAVAHDLATLRGSRAGPSLRDHVEAAVVIGALFVALLNWAVTPEGPLAPLVRKAIAAIPTVPVPPKDPPAR